MLVDYKTFRARPRPIRRALRFVAALALAVFVVATIGVATAMIFSLVPVTSQGE